MTGHLSWSCSVPSTSSSSCFSLSNLTSKNIKYICSVSITDMFRHSQHHHLVLGDHFHPPVDRALHLSGGCPLHHHLCRDPSQNARCQSGMASVDKMCHGFIYVSFQDHRRSSTNSALGYSFLVVPLLVFLVLLTNKLDQTVKISFFAATSPLFLTFFTLIITSFGTRGESGFQELKNFFKMSFSGGNQYWFGLRKPPCQFLFSVCPCLQLFGESLMTELEIY